MRMNTIATHDNDDDGIVAMNAAGDGGDGDGTHASNLTMTGGMRYSSYSSSVSQQQSHSITLICT